MEKPRYYFTNNKAKEKLDNFSATQYNTVASAVK